ncbi:Ferric uptake regulator family protein [Polaromonas sp. YR568]|uniref:transcriptional repressor n=1 Tax=Polaromonas sp. YR568 TaxID=1855301 RepID=UPI0008F3152E|nr:transcriptional repressor [Polaromonas sp. YR568]SFV00890.1 Ferric uptake regulator family protein [Polaromonas sp. YR568]
MRPPAQPLAPALTPRLQQVLAVFEATASEPLTADEVYQRLLARGTPASLSAVYRMVRRLHEDRLLACTPGKPGFGGGKNLFWLVFVPGSAETGSL